MTQLGSIIDLNLRKYLGTSIKELNEKITHSLENRLTQFITMNASFKDAKKAFQRTYFTELLTFSLGNISKAANISNLNRRHIHRVCNELDIDVISFRKQMIKPYYYLKENVKDLVGEKIEEFSDYITPQKLRTTYSNLSKISENIVVALQTIIPSYEEASNTFEKQYFGEILKSADFDIRRTAQITHLSKRSVFRKIKELSLEA